MHINVNFELIHLDTRAYHKLRHWFCINTSIQFKWYWVKELVYSLPDTFFFELQKLLNEIRKETSRKPGNKFLASFVAKGTFCDVKSWAIKIQLFLWAFSQRQFGLLFWFVLMFCYWISMYLQNAWPVY